MPGFLESHRWTHVHVQWIDKGAITHWPVTAISGTADGLQQLYNSTTKNEKVLEEILNELMHRLAGRLVVGSNDCHGAVGSCVVLARTQTSFMVFLVTWSPERSNSSSGGCPILLF